MKQNVPIIMIVIILILGVVWMFTKQETQNHIPLTPEPQVEVVTNFAECVAAGNAVMESYPRQCRNGDMTFTEFVGNELEKTDLIQLESPRPNQTVVSPLQIVGKARGSWFFEASFPVFLTDWDGRIIAQGIATAKADWMTTEFVLFETTLTFTVDTDAYSNRGTLILKKDNPSGLPEHDDALEIPVILGGIETP